ncbi:hypothetical protein JI721_11430 [Alicyclobacillus cycloheptanicus]|uniref:Uncharacterized protein n=1 Tax=Alicyclobacillus cycloheptanicus TaxID=1457 RepID=A0ABT9XFS5_9BACL|nr:hypothetical protein [Alicyclobacillus cycloheptanicus]MDQ0189149.1 hypothetical protein [Alicyclobacillus cycloheptanicus]WDM00342.1 hypothetical protein JI721_11430 [Alicyclobacillus cycloheptanicus]
MAELVRDGDELVLKLTTVEKMEGVHGDIRVPLASVQEVTVLNDVIHEVHGLKLPGSRLPGVFAMGTFVSPNETIFAIVHHQHKRGLRVRLRGASYDALVVGLDNPEEVAQSLGFL